jgi:hypothetical protein
MFLCYSLCCCIFDYRLDEEEDEEDAWEWLDSAPPENNCFFFSNTNQRPDRRTEMLLEPIS